MSKTQPMQVTTEVENTNEQYLTWLVEVADRVGEVYLTQDQYDEHRDDHMVHAQTISKNNGGWFRAHHLAGLCPSSDSGLQQLFKEGPCTHREMPAKWSRPRAVMQYQYLDVRTLKASDSTTRVMYLRGVHPIRDAVIKLLNVSNTLVSKGYVQCSSSIDRNMSGPVGKAISNTIRRYFDPTETDFGITDVTHPQAIEKISRQWCIESLNEVSDRINESPSIRTYQNAKDEEHPSHVTIAEIFGTWNEAKEAADLECYSSRDTQ